MKKTKETQGNSVGKGEAKCFDESVYYKKEKIRRLIDLNLLDKFCLVQYEGYKRQQRHKLGGGLDGLRQDIFATSKYISLQLGKAKICL